MQIITITIIIIIVVSVIIIIVHILAVTELGSRSHCSALPFFAQLIISLFDNSD